MLRLLTSTGRLPLLVCTAVLAGCGGGSSSRPPDPLPQAALTGWIEIEATTRVDVDTADRLDEGQALSNNVFNSPQFLPAAVVVAGYVSARDGSYPAIGEDTAFRFPADPRDVYEIPLLQGQPVTLQTFATRADSATPASATLEIRQRTAPYALVASAESQVEDVARLELPHSLPTGNYLVVVSAHPDSDPLRYVLSTSPVSDSVEPSLRWPDAAFEPGEAIVAWQQALPGFAAAARSSTQRGDGRWQEVRTLGRNLSLMRMGAMPAARGGDNRVATLEWIRELRERDDVAWAEPNYLVYSQSAPTAEPLYPRQWHYDLINAPVAWQLVPGGGAGAIVAVLDTGLFRSGGQWHPDLVGTVVDPLPPGADFVSSPLDDDDEPGRDNLPADPGDPFGSVYHGTHVAGTVAARADNNLGGTGVAWGSRILPVRVLAGSGTGTSSDLLDAIRWTAGLSDSVRKADIINMSLGGLPFVQSLNTVINEAVAQGVIFVGAAGNENTATPSYPAAFANVFSVSAVDGAGNRSGYSNFGSTIDIAAPGGDASRNANADGRADVVVSTGAAVVNGFPRAAFTGLQGTSMAAPHVSGVFALMKSVNPALDTNQVRALLENGDLTVDIGAPGRDTLYGWGLLDAGRASLSALAGTVPKLLTPLPASISFTDGQQIRPLELRVLNGTITLLALNGPAWLRISAPDNNQSDTAFELELELNPTELPDEALTQGTLQVEYQDDDGLERSLEVLVVARIQSDETARNAGTHFVILVETEPDPDTGFYRAVSQAIATAEDGRYRFRFFADDGIEPRRMDELVPGEYFLVAGSDIDNDGVICGDGEACAEYPIAGLRQSLVIESGQTLEDVLMTTSYTRPVISGSVLPRPGFRGYRLMTQPQPAAPRQVQ